MTLTEPSQPTVPAAALVAPVSAGGKARVATRVLHLFGLSHVIEPARVPAP